ncbi:MAG: hypothetical protein II388_05810 [Clostridia bacterium]|nr:hypothetical protein [Clostridia bacterium]
MSYRIEKTKEDIIDLLRIACYDKKINNIVKLSEAYNNLCQAQKSKMTPAVEFTKDGIRWDYDMPTVDRFNNIKK